MGILQTESLELGSSLRNLDYEMEEKKRTAVQVLPERPLSVRNDLVSPEVWFGSSVRSHNIDSSQGPNSAGVRSGRCEASGGKEMYFFFQLLLFGGVSLLQIV